MKEVFTYQELQAEIDRSEVPVLVDFYAQWCNPCKKMMPIIEGFSADNNKSILVLKVDVDVVKESSEELRIRGIPTLILYNKKEEKARKSGMLTRSAISAWTYKEVKVKDSITDIDISL